MICFLAPELHRLELELQRWGGGVPVNNVVLLPPVRPTRDLYLYIVYT